MKNGSVYRIVLLVISFIPMLISVLELITEERKIYHGDNIYALYAHMRYAPTLTVEDEVKQGQIIGYVGSTGNSSTPHLHLEISNSISSSDIYLLDPMP